MSTNEQTNAPVAETPEQPAKMTQQEIQEQKKSLKLFFKRSIDDLKPQVEFAQLKASHSKAVFENVYYSMKIEELSNRPLAETKEPEQEEEAKPEGKVVVMNSRAEQPDTKNE